MMSCAEVTISILDIIAWPVVTLVLAFAFRSHLGETLQRLRKAVLPGGTELEFQEQISRARELSQKVEAAPENVQFKDRKSLPKNEANTRLMGLSLRPSPSGLDFDYYEQIAQRDPNLALAALRIELEIMLQNLAKGFRIEFSPKISMGKLLSVLHREGAITENQMELGKQVLNLCNHAVHGGDISSSSALEVISIGRVLAQDYLNWLSWGFEGEWSPTTEQN